MQEGPKCEPSLGNFARTCLNKQKGLGMWLSTKALGSIPTTAKMKKKKSKAGCSMRLGRVLREKRQEPQTRTSPGSSPGTERQT